MANFRVTGNPDSGDGIIAHNVNELFIDGVSVSYHGGDGLELNHCYEDPRIVDSLITYNKQTGLNLIKRFEGLELEPYLCPAKVPTIGYGATYYPSGNKVKMTDSAISEEFAESILKEMFVRYEQGVERYVQQEINQNQFNALVSFAYNLGLGALKSSTLVSDTYYF